MSDFDPGAVDVLAFDVFGTVVDWYGGVSAQAGEIFTELGVDLDAGRFATDWRGRYGPSMARVARGEREWAYLDTLHRESLDDMLRERGLDASVDEAARRALVHAWHRLPAWDDSAAGLRRLAGRYVVTALSNGGFALLTTLAKSAGLPFDCIISAQLARAYKPDPVVYRCAAGLLDVDPGRVMMVAAHVWDLHGAREAGLRSAFVQRPAEKGPHGSADTDDGKSDLAVTSFLELADRLGC